MASPRVETTTVTWVGAGFLASYLVWFIYPTFLWAPIMRMPAILPARDPIGLDLMGMLDYSRAWVDGQNPYFRYNLYPPLAHLFYTPLLLLSRHWAYAVSTAVTVACFALPFFAPPAGARPALARTAVGMLILVTGLTSYGLQFEIERGQWNVMAMFLTLLAVWLRHRDDRFRYLAYALLSAAVQLKVYPLMFAVLLIKDWRRWRENTPMLAGLGLVNAALLFALGPSMFSGFIGVTRASFAEPYVWIGNHSIHAFVSTVTPGMPVLRPILTVAALGCLAAVVALVWRDARSGWSSHLLMACTLAACLLPSVSHDYKLAILPAPMALLALDDRLPTATTHSLLMAMLAAVYATTLFSYASRPGIIDNCMPLLMLMLIAVTVSAWWSRQTA